MKTKLLILTCLCLFNLNAQTTHELNWFTNIGTNVDLTIETGDTVRWTWTSANHSVENNPAGTSVETFDSGILGPNGSTFSYTFTVLGTNDYYCIVHSAGSMSGTITVQDNLNVDKFEKEEFIITPNPSFDRLNINLANLNSETKVEVFDILGKRIHFNTLTSAKSSINVSSWSLGIYLVKVTNGFGIQTKRFIKQ
jgi:hypothetical protein